MHVYNVYMYIHIYEGFGLFFLGFTGGFSGFSAGFYTTCVYIYKTIRT